MMSMPESETLEKSEADAIDDAVAEVADLLKDNKSLDMIEQHIYRMTRKKDMVETRLKEAVEAQLRGVRTGLFNLQKVMREANEICTSMKTVNTMYKSLNEQLGENAKDIKDTRVVHREHALLHSYLQSIYNFKEDVKTAHLMLRDDNLLNAHGLLMKLEDCRNGIYKEVMNDEVDDEKRERVEEFFSGLKGLNKAFSMKIHFFLTRALNSIRSGKTCKMVSMLRIVEREEKRDAQIARELQAHPNLSFPGRPKKWKEMALAALSSSISSTFESAWELNQEDESWILRFAQKIKDITEKDLRVVDQHLQHCFPPQWDILEFFCTEYVSNIRLRFEEIIRQIQTTQGQASSYTIVFNWTTVLNNIIKPYREPGKHVGILTPGNIDKLVKIYTDRLDHELSRQTEKILKLERDSRYEINKSPDGANLEIPHYHTTTPVIFYEMINQNLEFAFKLENKMDLLPVLEKLDLKIVFFIEKYLADICEFRDKYFSVSEDEKEDMKYIEWLISAANNAIKCSVLNEELVNSLVKQKDKDISGYSLLQQENLIANKTELYQERLLKGTCVLLSDLVFCDLKLILPKLYTQEWIDKKYLQLAKGTIEDYNQSYFQFIDEPGNKFILNVIADQLLVEYLIALFNTKSLSITADSFKDLLDGDHDKICNFFENGLKLKEEFNRNELECMKVIAELVSASEDLVDYEMADFVNKYPDVMWDQCVALLALRGNMNREAIRELVSSSGIQEYPEEGQQVKQTIFSRVHEKTGPLASRFFQTVVAPRTVGFKTQNSAALNTSVTGNTPTSFSKITTAVSNSPVYHAINQAWNDKDQISSRVARALEFGNAEQTERTNPFYDPREDKGPTPKPPAAGGSDGKGPAPKPPARKKGPAPAPPVASTNPFEFDDD